LSLVVQEEKTARDQVIAGRCAASNQRSQHLR